MAPAHPRPEASDLRKISKAPRREEGQCWEFALEMLGSAPPKQRPHLQKQKQAPCYVTAALLEWIPPSLSTPWRERWRKETGLSQKTMDSDQRFSMTSPNPVWGATALLLLPSWASIMMTTC